MRSSFLLVLLGIAFCQKASWNKATANERLDDAITNEFNVTDMDGNGLVTIEEIREYYENHLNKLSNEGIDFIDRNFHNEKSVDIDTYRKLVKEWLTEKKSVEKILVGLFGNRREQLQESSSSTVSS